MTEAAAVDPAVLDRFHKRGELHPSEMRPWQLAIAEIKSEASEVDGFAVAQDVADKIMRAETIDDVLGIPENGPGDITDLVGRSFRFLGGPRYSVGAEKYKEGGTGFYVVFRVLFSDGFDALISTGATNIIFQMKRLGQLGALGSTEAEPSEMVYTMKCRDTARGTLYWLAAAIV